MLRKYEIKFDDDNFYDPARIETYMIQQGGQWTAKNGKVYGNGLFYHYKELQKALWPKEDHHRWSDLILTEILNNTITAILGPKDAGKTRTASKYGLCDYFCFPQETLILISSTDVRGLEMRVWGDLKMLWESAKERFDWLPGNVLDSKHSICTDSLEDKEVRDMRKGIMCFPEGTPVDTPSGPISIEQLSIGDEVTNATGSGRILETYSRISTKLLRVKLSDGNSVDCTPEHPFLTNRGWVKAVDLLTFDRVYSAHETLLILQETSGSRLSEPEVLFRSVSELQSTNPMPPLPKGIFAVEEERLQTTILFDNLRKSMGRESWNVSEESKSKVRHLRKVNVSGPSESNILFDSMPHSANDSAMQILQQPIYLNMAIEEERTNRFLRRLLQMEMDKPNQRSQSPYSNATTDRSSFLVHRSSSDSLRCLFRAKDGQEYQTQILPRRGVSIREVGCGDRRKDSCEHANKGYQRQKKDRGTSLTWVDSVEVLESTGDKRFDKGRGGYQVYNLHIEGHPSYSVKGVIVHNCIPCMSAGGQFVGLGKAVGIKQKRRRLIGDEFALMKDGILESVANLNSGDFKGVFIGNPIGQEDPLDKVSEPKNGWDSIKEPEKTTVWENRWIGGRTINLVGTDSPNFDYPEDKKPRYGYMVNKNSIAAVEAFYTKDSMTWYSQCKGVRRGGINAHRVITREMCEQRHAFDDVVWSGTERIKIAAVDAAYGGVGGDRCVGGHIEFGLDVEGKTILAIHPPLIIPVSIRKQTRPEEQIAEWTRDYCKALDIPPENTFHDATGRGSLGTAFARLWSAEVCPVEFGGRATNRIVSPDLLIIDRETGERRAKLCYEEYGKFVSEMWFSVKYVIEAEQMRGLPVDVAKEGYSREWIWVAGNKMDVETKDKTKARTGRSPDLFDWLATAVEGARRRGFVIARQGKQSQSDSDERWLENQIQEHRGIMRKSLLTHN